ncbi:MAG: hypothetical protein HY816_19670 [Candidatus Wallbacteria bacterium]|nr:hypothetical protein [Candidatus Wallbacteria bacterium]
MLSLPARTSAKPALAALIPVLVAALCATPAQARADDLDELLADGAPAVDSLDLPEAGDAGSLDPTAASSAGLELDLGELGDGPDLESTAPAAALTQSAQDAWSLLHALSQRIRSPGNRPLTKDQRRALESRLTPMTVSVPGPLGTLARSRAQALVAASESGLLPGAALTLEEALEARAPSSLQTIVGVEAAAAAWPAQARARLQLDRWTTRLEGLIYARRPAPAGPGELADFAGLEPLGPAPLGAPSHARDDADELLAPVAAHAADVYVEAAGRHGAAGRHELAARCYARASALEPANPVHPYSRSRALYRQGLFEEALAEATRSSGLGLADWRVFGLQIGCLRALGRFGEVAPLARDALEGAEGGGVRAYLHCQLASEELAEGRARPALELLRLARTGFVPAELEARQACLTALALESLGYPDRARRALEEAQGIGASSTRLERLLSRLKQG